MKELKKFSLLFVSVFLCLISCESTEQTRTSQMRQASAAGLCFAFEYQYSIAVKAIYADGHVSCGQFVSAEWVSGTGTELRIRVRFEVDGVQYAIEANGQTGKADAYAYPDTTALETSVVTDPYTPFVPQIKAKGTTFTFRVLGLEGSEASQDKNWCPAIKPDAPLKPNTPLIYELPDDGDSTGQRP